MELLSGQIDVANGETAEQDAVRKLRDEYGNNSSRLVIVCIDGSNEGNLPDDDFETESKLAAEVTAIAVEELPMECRHSR
ncbi:hypothetical protein SEUCBS140593_005683 [Sporothrix eucalyptigena]|uniref:VWFA domain-containing protein n=1 Tax=Sporothrix eucalyptigena TaxID=1812306 RepID=A0ABP0C0C7_9PEZI